MPDVAPDGETFATRDLASKLGVSASTVRSRLQEAIEEGVVRFAGKEPRPNIAGGTSPVPVYEIVEEDNE